MPRLLKSHSADGMQIRRPTRILHVLGSLERGGAETRMMEVFENLFQSGRLPDTHILLLSGSFGHFADKAKSYGIHLHLGNASLFGICRAARILRREKITVLHSHVHRASGPFIFAGFLLGVRMRVTHLRSTGDGKSASRIRNLRNYFFEMLILAFSTHLLAANQVVFEKVLGAGRKSKGEMLIAPQGVDVRKALREVERGYLTLESQHEDVVEIIQLARLDCEKNQNKTIEIFSEVSRLYPSARLVFYGEGSTNFSEQLARRVNQLGLGDRVIFGGVTDEPFAKLATSTVMLHPTLREGWPGVIFEAFSCGLPVVATKLPEIESSVGAKPGIYLVGQEEPLDSWVATVVHAIETSPDMRTRKEHAARMAGTDIDNSVMAEYLFALWTDHLPNFENDGRINERS